MEFPVRSGARAIKQRHDLGSAREAIAIERGKGAAHAALRRFAKLAALIRRQRFEGLAGPGLADRGFEIVLAQIGPATE